MKWIYKGLARPELGSSGVLLGWHEKVSSQSFRCPGSESAKMLIILARTSSRGHMANS